MLPLCDEECPHIPALLSTSRMPVVQPLREEEKCVSEGVEGKSLNSRFKCYMNQKEKQLYEEC